MLFSTYLNQPQFNHHTSFLFLPNASNDHLINSLLPQLHSASLYPTRIFPISHIGYSKFPLQLPIIQCFFISLHRFPLHVTHPRPVHASPRPKPHTSTQSTYPPHTSLQIHHEPHFLSRRPSQNLPDPHSATQAGPTLPFSVAIALLDKPQTHTQNAYTSHTSLPDLQRVAQAGPTKPVQNLAAPKRTFYSYFLRDDRRPDPLILKVRSLQYSFFKLMLTYEATNCQLQPKPMRSIPPQHPIPICTAHQLILTPYTASLSTLWPTPTLIKILHPKFPKHLQTYVCPPSPLLLISSQTLKPSPTQSQLFHILLPFMSHTHTHMKPNFIYPYSFFLLSLSLFIPTPTLYHLFLNLTPPQTKYSQSPSPTKISPSPIPNLTISQFHFPPTSTIKPPYNTTRPHKLSNYSICTQDLPQTHLHH